MSAGPVLVTERLELWKPRVDDFESLNALNTDPRTLTYLGNWTSGPADTFARLTRNAGCWALYGYGTFMVRLKGAEQIVGNCGVFHSWRGFAEGLNDVPEAGWIVHPDHWGQGYAGEAMAAVMPWFDANFGPRRVACMIEEGHAVSERLAAKLGFVAYTRHQQPEEKPLVLYERG